MDTATPLAPANADDPGHHDAMSAPADRKTVVRSTRCLLRDGTRVVVRPVRQADARHAKAFFGWLSDETRYLRFMYAAKELTPEMMRSALEQDGLRRVSLVVEPIEPVERAPGEPPAIALGRYAPGSEADSCEVAITVGDPWQRRGVGHTLLRRLIVLARRGGYRTMCATAFSTNARMVGLARAFGFDVRQEAGGVTAMRLVL